MNNLNNYQNTELNPLQVTPSWAALSDNILELAIRKSDCLIAADIENPKNKDLDAGARVIRALMGAAEIATRMSQWEKREKQEKQEREAHEVEAILPEYSEADIKRRYETIEYAFETFAEENGVAIMDPATSSRDDCGERSGDCSDCLLYTSPSPRDS